MAIENDGNHIQKIVDSTTCKKHKATSGVACWHVYISCDQRLAPAVCGARIRRAGFNGTISESSLSQKVGGRSGGRSRKA